VDRRQAAERAVAGTLPQGSLPAGPGATGSEAAEPGAAGLYGAAGPGAGGPGAAGLYGPRSEAWRLNREAALLLGAGPRALLLQVAHPLVAEGVNQHSDFRADPWTRLAGTLRSYLRIVYGTTGAARSEIRRLNALHAGVTGPVEDPVARRRHGARYAARDPELALWVHATLVDSTMAATGAWMAPLSVARRARFYAETREIGRAFGIPESLLPADVDAFDGYVASMLAAGGPVHPTGTARTLAETILHPSLGPLAGRGALARRLGPVAPALATVLDRIPIPLYDWLLVPAVGLLPASVRREYGLPWGRRERAIEAWLVTAWGAWRPLLPRRWRWFPQALAAERRLGTPMAVPSGRGDPGPAILST
jgi:uncharacterized protein (DUF2236 family)